MKQEIHTYIQAYLEKMEAKGIHLTMEQINAYLSRCISQLNNASKAEFEGYSPLEIAKILHHPFDSDSPLQLHSLLPDEYTRMPLFQQVKYLLQTIAGQEVKLTTAGYLPPRLVKELYPLGLCESLIDRGLYKLTKEIDSSSVVLAKNITKAAGLIKVRKGVLSPTARGMKLRNDDTKLFQSIFETFCQKINWGYFDGYQSDQIGTAGFGFTLILLYKYGERKREDHFYAQKYFHAFPELMEGINPSFGVLTDYCNSCYSLHTFDRFLLHFSLVQIFGESKPGSPKYIIKTNLFDRLIKISPHREYYID